jgi:hypothetical protein
MVKSSGFYVNINGQESEISGGAALLILLGGAALPGVALLSSDSEEVKVAQQEVEEANTRRA